jgi:energy-coupling factor transporter ATP-binding protein EcfA2
MTEQARSVALVGMPGSGKSTFVAALYHVLTESLPDIPLQLRRQPAARAYLQELCEAWLRGEPVGRTQRDSGELIELELAAGSEEFTLTIPDVAGESFKDVFVTRAADARLVELVRDAGGLLLFLHPNDQRPRVLISQAKQVAQALGETLLDDPRDFDPVKVPAETQLVDLLQWVIGVREQAPTRLALVVSAWDRCPSEAPPEWLAGQVPMLTSFLQGRQDILNTRVFGVSAQGGDYDDGIDLSAARPYERAYLVDERGERHADLTAPLRWAALG